MTDPLHKQYLNGGPHADDANGHCSVSTEPHVDLRTRADLWHLHVLCIRQMAVAIMVLCMAIERRWKKVAWSKHLMNIYGLTHGFYPGLDLIHGPSRH